MSWFDTSGFTSLAKSALKEAQKTIDKALDIQQDENGQLTATKKPKSHTESSTPVQKDSSDFFSSWGLTTSNSLNMISTKDQPVITQSPSKAMSHSLWGSFAGSFFESEQNELGVNLSDPQMSNESKETVSDDVNQTELLRDNENILKNNVEGQPVVMRRSLDKHNSINRLSMISTDSKNSSESIEVLGTHSLKTTPDSDVTSLNNSVSSNSLKLASSSVEVIPDSLVSQSSIELLGFSHSGSDDEFGSPLTSPIDKDNSSTQNTEDDIKIISDVNANNDDEEVSAADDTISYNSVSEFTAPTILDSSNILKADMIVRKPQFCSDMIDSFGSDGSSNILHSSEDVPITRAPGRTVLQFSPIMKEFFQMNNCDNIIQPSSLLTDSYNSSNEGSWSDRTVNAETDLLDSSTEDVIKKTVITDKLASSFSVKGMLEDAIIDKLSDKISDSSSYCKINDEPEAHAAWKETDHSCSSQSYEEVDKASSIEHLGESNETFRHREPTSPVSSDGRSIDMVKIGSEQTSGHTSGDDLETTTSSDIEIIPSPNGEYGVYCRQSPAKVPSKFAKHQTGHVVDLVLGKALASKIRGHTRELSGASVQSNASDDSHCSEVDRLMKRLAEMTEILESRESKLIEISRNNIELNESNTELKQQLENFNKQDISDVNIITEEYTQRLSALEKKFQQAIRDKDVLRKQTETYKQEAAMRISSSNLETVIGEKDEIIKELREEGEKLSKLQLHHSTIIKRLRSKEKENEQVIKTLRDKIAEQAQELDRLKRSLTAKETAESTHIETVYKLTTSNKKLENEISEAKSQLDDTTQKFDTIKKSFDAAKKEVTELQRNCGDREKNQEVLTAITKEKAVLESENEQLSHRVDELRTLLRQEEQRWMGKESSLRSEVARQLARAEDAESALQISKNEIEMASSCDGMSSDGGALLAQLAALQESSLERDRRFQTTERRLQQLATEAQTKLTKATEANQLFKDECQSLRSKLASTEISLSHATQKLDNCTLACEEHMSQLNITLESSNRLKQEFESFKDSSNKSIEELSKNLKDLEQQFSLEKTAHEAEKRRSVILQEQLKETSSSMDPASGSSLLLARLVGTGEMIGAPNPINNSADRGGNSSPHGSTGRDSLASESLGSGVWPADDGDSCVIGSVSGNINESIMPGGDGGLCTLERLQAALQRREGELRAARKAGKRSHAQRTALARELALHAAELDTMQSLQHQYDALLQMYGEKEEQLQELRLDLQDVKDMYKMQLDEILMLKRLAKEKNNQQK